MVAGHLREQNGYFQMILSWKDSNGKRRSKSISTGLPIKGNKKRAEAMLLKAREEFNLENLVENANVPLCDFFQKWLKDRAISMGARVYANYAYDVKAYIAPYFRENPVSVLKVTSKELEAFYRFERQEDDATPEDLLQYHEVVTACLGYAEELGWIEENPAEEVNPCADQAPILFDEFIREWLEIIRSKIGEITYASYKRNVEKCIAPYFKARRYTLQDLERHPKYIHLNRKYLGFCTRSQFAYRGTPAPGRSAARPARWSVRPHQKSPWTLPFGCPAVPVRPASASPVPILRHRRFLFSAIARYTRPFLPCRCSGRSRP